jgi:putative ABC transport system ATP-binding protein
MPLIHLNNVCKIYNEGKDSEFYALNNISLKIEKNDFIAIKGASGSGKSTLLHIIGCLDVASSGTYILDEVDIKIQNNKKLSKLRNEKFGFVLQDFGLINDETVLKNVYLPLMFNTTPISQMRKLALEKLKQLNIIHLADRIVEDLSGGEKQRVAIARALINNPEIILADEPTGSLDSKNSDMIMKIFSELNKIGKTIIIITHEEFVADYCKKVFFLSDGKFE